MSCSWVLFSGSKLKTCKERWKKRTVPNAGKPFSRACLRLPNILDWDKDVFSKITVIKHKTKLKMEWVQSKIMKVLEWLSQVQTWNWFQNLRNDLMITVQVLPIWSKACKQICTKENGKMPLIQMCQADRDIFETQSFKPYLKAEHRFNNLSEIFPLFILIYYLTWSQFVSCYNINIINSHHRP